MIISLWTGANFIPVSVYQNLYARLELECRNSKQLQVHRTTTGTQRWNLPYLKCQVYLREEVLQAWSNKCSKTEKLYLLDQYNIKGWLTLNDYIQPFSSTKAVLLFVWETHSDWTPIYHQNNDPMLTFFGVTISCHGSFQSMTFHLQ